MLADFISAAFKAHRLQYDENTYPRLEWDIGKVMGISDDQFWSVIDATPGFWESIERYPYSKLLVTVASNLAPVSLLSSPSKHPTCHYGKRVWVDRYFPQHELILCKSKYWLAAPGRILIDDNDGNIAKWRAAGGSGILFPQPWNANHTFVATSVSYTLDRLNDLSPAVRAG